MRIGIVTDWTTTGAGEVSRSLAKVLLNQCNEVFVYARFDQHGLPQPKIDGVDVIWGKNPFNPHPKAIDRLDLINWIFESSPDLIIFNEQIWIQPVIWARNENIPCVAYIDYYKEDSVSQFSIYDGLICNTLRHLSVFSWHPQAIYIPWGVDHSLFSKQPSSHGEAIFFHSCGTSPRRKGTDIFVRSLALASDLQAIIHSQLPISDLLPELSETIKELTLNGTLENLVGDFPAPGLYHLGSVYVYPNRLDGLGLTVTEALTSGLPVIATDFAPINEIVNESNGILIPPYKVWARADGYYWPQAEIRPEDLMLKMKYLRDHPETLNFLSANALQFSTSDLDLFRNFSEISNYLNRVRESSSWSANRYGVEDSLDRISVRSTPLILFALHNWHKIRHHLSRAFALVYQMKNTLRRPN